MKTLSLFLLLTSFAAMADETCRTSLYDFRITNKYIQADGQGEHVRIPYSEMRTLSRRNRTDFKNLIRTLSDEITTDSVLTKTESTLIERFSLTVADGHEELIGMMYAKAFDEQGQIVARFMVTEDGSYRCQ